VAKTRKKRRRKHSGTQAGTVQRQAPQRTPQTKEERREYARRRRTERLERPPTLRGSVGRAAIGAAIFAAVVTLGFGRSPVQGLSLGIVMFLLYIPIGYLVDLFLHRRHQRKKRGTESREGAGEGKPSRPRRARGER
jgi:hypothetical protein